jgi:transcriptional regulator with XRE-family HTH domain
MDEGAKLDRNYLKEWRQLAGLTQEEVGRRLGVTGAQVSRIETGARFADLLYLQKFKEMLNAHLLTLPGVSIRVGHVGELLMCNPDPLSLVAHGSFAQHRWRQLVTDIIEQLGMEIDPSTGQAILPIRQPATSR